MHMTCRAPKIPPYAITPKALSVAHDQQAVFGSREGHIDALSVSHVSDVFSRVAAHERQNDNVGLATLRRVHRHDSSFACVLVLSEHLLKQPQLRLVHRDDDYLLARAVGVREKGRQDPSADYTRLFTIFRRFAVL